MNKMIQRIIITVFLLALTALSIPSQSVYAVNNSNTDGYISVVYNIAEISKNVTSKEFPDANSVILDQTANINYREDGTWTQWHEAYIKILTRKGREDHLTVSSYYTIPYQNDEDCRVDLIEIIKPDGSRHEINIAEQSTVAIRTSDMDSNIYDPRAKSITVNVKGLEVGDILHYKMYDNTVLPRAKGVFTDIFSLEGSNPILSINIRINAPNTLPLKKIEILDEIPGSVDFTQTDSDDSITYNWQVTDVAQAIPEPDMPSLYTCTQRLLVSTAPDWQTISKWYWNLSKPALQSISPEIEAKVAELIKGAYTPEEKIQRIFRFVSQEIRYMGITTETVAPGLEPRPVDQTFEAKYGVCRDKAALLAAMLTEAGIDSYPVLIHNGDKKDPEVPNTYFNHAVTAARIYGEYILMDSTDESTLDLLPAYLNDKSFLVATPNGETLMTSEIVPASSNLLKIETTGNLSGNGKLTATSKMTFNGINDNAFRSYFTRINHEERKRLFESIISRVYGGGSITECIILPEDLQDTSQVLTAQISYTTSDILAKENGLALMPAPFISKVLGLVNNIYFSAELEKRRFPFIINFTSGVTENVKISVDSDIKKILSLPVYSPVKSDQIEWTRSLAQVKNNIIGNNTFMIKDTEFLPDEYLELKKALNAIEYNNRKKPVLAVTQEAPEVTKKIRNYDVTVNKNINFNVTSDSSWERIEETTKVILTYAGKKDHSEIKINYNPVWEEVELLGASVISPTGEKQSISDKEINIMDQEWNGLAPRYPGGKTIVASFPGVEIGSTIKYRIKHTLKNQPFFSMQETFASFNPLSKSISIKGIDGLNVQSMWNGPETRYDHKNKVFNWVMSNTPLKKESFLPPASSFQPTVAVSSGDWRTYSRTILSAMKDAAQNQNKSEELALELTRDINDSIKRIIVIRDYIYKNIRLAGPGFSALPTSLITPADITLSEGYGNTTDRAVLFYTMLKAIGEDPEFYITTPFRSAEGLKTPILENPQNRILQNVLIKLEHSSVPIWLNDTTEYAQLGTTPNLGNIALNLKTGKFDTVHVYKTFMPEMNAYYFVNLSDNADATISVTKEFYGDLYEINNKMFNDMTPEETKIFYQRELSTIAQAASAESELEINFKSYPGKVSYTAKVPKLGVIDNKYIYFNLPKSFERIFNLMSENRDNPLYINKYIRKKINVLIALPDNYNNLVISPNNFDWDSPMYNGDIEIRSSLITPLALKSETIEVPATALRDELNNTLLNSRNALLITMDAKVAPALYPAALYPLIISAQNQLFSPAAKEIMLTGSDQQKKP